MLIPNFHLNYTLWTERGYPSFEQCIKIQESGDLFVIRCKESFCSEVKEFVASGKEEAILSINLSAKNLKHNEFFTSENAPKNMKMRIVRILLSDGNYEYLLTNTDFTNQELKELYHKRWGVESFYFILKDHMQLENFSSKITEGIKQDFFAKILTFNITQLFIEEAPTGLSL